MKTSLFCGMLAAGITLYYAPPQVAHAAPPVLPNAVRAHLMAHAATLRAQWAARVARGDAPAKTTEPSVTAGSILTPNVDITVAPGEVGLELQLNSGTVGIADVIVQMAAPSGLHVVYTDYSFPQYPPTPRKRLLAVNIGGFNLYAESGPWAIVDVALVSDDGTNIVYSGNQLAALFPSLIVNVTNPNPADITKPTFGMGKILTPTISLSAAAPYFAAKLAVADNLSGVGSLELGIVDPNGRELVPGARFALAAPILRGTLVPAAGISKNAPTGTYTIQNINVCDWAGNCLNDTNAADIQNAFGATTFQVTN
jgi:hypothetical protein